MYFKKSISTGKWNPFEHVKNIFVDDKPNRDQGKLEKDILYEEAIKTLKE